MAEEPCGALDGDGPPRRRPHTLARITPRRRSRALLGFVVLIGASSLTTVSAGPAAALPTHPGTIHFDGLGVDSCSSPSNGILNALHARGFRSFGAYLGGPDYPCGWRLSAGDLSRLFSHGFDVEALWVGPVCTTDGRDAADAAVRAAQAAGIFSGPIFNDYEPFGRGWNCFGDMAGFVASWSTELRHRGYEVGLYGDWWLINEFVATLPGWQRPDEVISSDNGWTEPNTWRHHPGLWHANDGEQYAMNGWFSGGAIDYDRIDADLLGPVPPHVPPHVVGVSRLRPIAQ